MAVGASERNEWSRVAWKVTIAGVLNSRRLVFVDECGTHVSLAPIYGYSPTATPVSIDPCVVASFHETVFEGSEVEGALGRRCRYTKGRGRKHLLGVGGI